MKESSSLFPALMACVLLTCASSAPAQDGAWSAGSSGLWSDPAHWTSNTVANGASQIADFSTLDILSGVAVHLDSARTIGQLVFGDTDTNTAAGWMLDNNGNTANVLTLAGTNPAITVNALGAGQSVTISADIAGTQGLTKNGPGPLIFAGPGSYTGTTTNLQGTLQFGMGGAGGLNTSNIVNNGLLIFDLPGNAAYAGNISGPGGFAHIAAGTLTLIGTNNYSGTTTIQGGTLQIGDGGTSGIVGGNIITNNGVLVFNRSDPVFFLTNTIVGSGSLVSVPPYSTNVLVLRPSYQTTGASTYTGGTVIGNGLVALGNWPEANPADLIWDTFSLGFGPVTITNNAVLAMAASYDQWQITSSTYTPIFSNDVYVPSGQTGSFLAYARMSWQSIVSGSNNSTLNLQIPWLLTQLYCNFTNFYGTLNVFARSDATTTYGSDAFGVPVNFRKRDNTSMPNTRLHIDSKGPGVGIFSTAGGTWVIGELMGPNGCVLGGSSFNAGQNTTVVIGGLNSSNYMGGRIVDGETIVKIGTGPFWVCNTTNSYSGETVIAGGIFGLGSPAVGTGSPVLSNTTPMTVGPFGTFDCSVLSGPGIYDGYLLLSNRVLAGLGVITGNVVAACGAGISPGTRSNSFAAQWLSLTNLDLSGALTLTNSSLTFLGSSTNFFKLSSSNTLNDPSGTNNDMLVVGGNLTLTNTNNLPTYLYLPNQISLTPLGAGAYKLIQYAGRLDGDATNNLRLTQRLNGALSSDTTNEIDLLVNSSSSAAASLVWKGGLPGNPSGSYSALGSTNYWDMTTSSNWYNGGGTDVFWNGDYVLFTDWYTNADGPQNPGTNTLVAVWGQNLMMAPGWITVNSTNNWTFAQAWTNSSEPNNRGKGGRITGVGGLTKTGSGSLVMLLPTNNYTGPNFLSGGIFVVTNVSSFGSDSPLGNQPVNDPTNLVLNNIVFRVLLTNYVATTPVGGNGTNFQMNRAMTLAGDTTFDVPFTTNVTVAVPPRIGAWQTNQLTLSGTIVGPGGLTKTGGGYLVLNNNTNLYTGPTVIVPNYITYFTNVGSNPLTFTNGRLIFSGNMNAWVWYSTNTTTGVITTNTPSNFSLSNSPSIWVQRGAILDVSPLTNWLTQERGEYPLASNQTLKGAGTVLGSILANNTTAITVGDSSTNTGTLTITNNCILSNTVVNLKLNRALAQNCDQIAGEQILFGGTLNVTNAGPPLQTGDRFYLFGNETFRDGSFATLNLPMLYAPTNQPCGTLHYGYLWENHLQEDGSIRVGTVVSMIIEPCPPTPTNLTMAVTASNTMVLSWPTDYIGWALQNQTNPLNVGVKLYSSNWFEVPGSTSTNQVIIPLVKTNPTVFYRMIYTNSP